MANKEILTQQAQSQDPEQQAFGVVQPSSSLSGSFMTKDAAAYDMGELDHALFLYLDGHEPLSAPEEKQTLNIFPSQPMHVDLGVVSPAAFVIKKPPDRTANSTRSQSVTISGPRKDVKPADKAIGVSLPPFSCLTKFIRSSLLFLNQHEGSRKGGTSSAVHEDPKTLRRLAQNREAARKSRLRKKAYIQQLESSRVKLAQLEQELHRTRSQGVLVGATPGDQVSPSGIGSISADAAMFDAEYARWLDEHHRLMWELRSALQEQMPENGLKMFVDSCLAHYDEIIILKTMLARSDVFHLLSGIWKTPAERCFMWLGGFRPSDVIKIIVGQIEPLTEQQMMGLYSLRTSTDQAESTLTQGLDDLQRSLSAAIASNELSHPSNVSNYIGQMSMAVSRLSTLEGLVRQADSLRQQTLHRLHQMLSTRQAARCFLAMSEYFHRLRALSSLWIARPRQE